MKDIDKTNNRRPMDTFALVNLFKNWPEFGIAKMKIIEITAINHTIGLVTWLSNIAEDWLEPPVPNIEDK